VVSVGAMCLADLTREPETNSEPDY
jgi:hypothetical protein